MHILSRLLPYFLLALIGCSLAWQGVAWQRLLHSQPAKLDPTATDQPVQQNLDELLPLFADNSASDGATPNTNLELVLLGSFANANPEQSSALIQSENGQAKRYQVGQQFSAGISLHAVYPDKVELLRNGRLETLMFKRAAQADNTATSTDYAQDAVMPPSDTEQLSNELEALQQQLQPEEPATQTNDMPMEGTE